MDADHNRLELAELATTGIEQMRAAGAPVEDRVEVLLADLDNDEVFWSRQADALAVFVTPGHIQTHRLPNRLSPVVEVSDRPHIQGLLRSVTFPHAATYSPSHSAQSGCRR